jgi:hypothetical protein
MLALRQHFKGCRTYQVRNKVNVLSCLASKLNPSQLINAHEKDQTYFEHITLRYKWTGKARTLQGIRIYMSKQSITTVKV